MKEDEAFPIQMLSNEEVLSIVNEEYIMHE